jgi:hypothetical protein
MPQPFGHLAVVFHREILNVAFQLFIQVQLYVF